MFYPLLQALIGLTFLIVLWAGGVRLTQGKISIGSFVMLNTYMGMLIWPMIAFGWVVNLMQRGNASFQRIHQMLLEKPAIATPANAKELPTPVRGEIELRNVSMAYPSGKALDHVNLRIAAGARVAIVGHTGSGKSTLVHLIPRLMDPTEGSVLVDGLDVREISPHQLRRAIGFVPQETFLFSATIGENIAFGNPQATDAEIRRAAEIAGLVPDIETF